MWWVARAMFVFDFHKLEGYGFIWILISVKSVSKMSVKYPKVKSRILPLLKNGKIYKKDIWVLVWILVVPLLSVSPTCFVLPKEGKWRIAYKFGISEFEKWGCEFSSFGTP